jgi:YVTN family beta-propeller protein
MRNAIRLFAPNTSVPHHAGLLHYLSIVLFLLLSMEVGLGTTKVQAQTRAYVTTNAVSVIDTATNTVVATIPVGVSPIGVAITPDGTRAYVTNEGSNTVSGTVSVIDTATNTVVATIPVGPGPFGIAITPAPQAPTSKEQCKHGGYLKFGPPAGPFKNQGQCVSYVEHH